MISFTGHSLLLRFMLLCHRWYLLDISLSLFNYCSLHEILPPNLGLGAIGLVKQVSGIVERGCEGHCGLGNWGMIWLRCYYYFQRMVYNIVLDSFWNWGPEVGG
jgi:hypothetical protein